MSYLADQLKEKGNDAFRNQDYAEAEDLYTQAVQKYSRNQLIFTNRANARLKLQKWEGAVDDCMRSIDITGPTGQNHKAWYFLAQAQLSLHHPHEALSSALQAYEQVLHPPSPSAKISPSDLQTFSQFVLKCKKAKFSSRERERLRRQGDQRAELESDVEARLQSELDAISAQLHAGTLGQVEALERGQEAAAAAETKKTTLRDVFAAATPSANVSSRERERVRGKGDLRAEVEGILDERLKGELEGLAGMVRVGSLGEREAGRRRAEAEARAEDRRATLRAVFAVADSAMNRPREVPDHLVDMITFEPMHDPVITKNGHSYERATLYEHLKRSPTDPLTRDPLAMADLRSNFGLKAACDEFWESGASEWIGDW